MSDAASPIGFFVWVEEEMNERMQLPPLPPSRALRICSLLCSLFALIGVLLLYMVGPQAVIDHSSSSSSTSPRLDAFTTLFLVNVALLVITPRRGVISASTAPFVRHFATILVAHYALPAYLTTKHLLVDATLSASAAAATNAARVASLLVFAPTGLIFLLSYAGAHPIGKIRRTIGGAPTLRGCAVALGIVMMIIGQVIAWGNGSRALSQRQSLLSTTPIITDADAFLCVLSLVLVVGHAVGDSSAIGLGLVFTPALAYHYVPVPYDTWRSSSSQLQTWLIFCGLMIVMISFCTHDAPGRMMTAAAAVCDGGDAPSRSGQGAVEEHGEVNRESGDVTAPIMVRGSHPSSSPQKSSSYTIVFLHALAVALAIGGAVALFVVASNEPPNQQQQQQGSSGSMMTTHAPTVACKHWRDVVGATTVVTVFCNALAALIGVPSVHLFAVVVMWTSIGDAFYLASPSGSHLPATNVGGTLLCVSVLLSFTACYLPHMPRATFDDYLVHNERLRVASVDFIAMAVPGLLMYRDSSSSMMMGAMVGMALQMVFVAMMMFFGGAARAPDLNRLSFFVMGNALAHQMCWPVSSESMVGASIASFLMMCIAAWMCARHAFATASSICAMSGKFNSWQQQSSLSGGCPCDDYDKDNDDGGSGLLQNRDSPVVVCGCCFVCPTGAAPPTPQVYIQISS